MGDGTYIVPANEQTLMDTDLNALANSKVNVGGVVIDNTTNRYFYAIVEIYLPIIDLSALTNPCVELYLVPSYDGTNYADTGIDDSITVYPPIQYLNCILGIGETNAAHRAVSPHLMLDPLKYTPVIINKTGAALAGTLNTLKIKTYTATMA